ncbi:MAG: PAS domain-containing protein, partial [Deltaproteobacteria bacterium]|nr:PAS domain-containing protein [Deltaproteobacteria bacterium]
MSEKQSPLARKTNQEYDPDFFRRFADLSYTWESWRNLAGDFIYVSPSCEWISGYPPEEFYHNNKLMEKIIHPDQLKRWLNHQHKVLETGDHESLDFLIVTKSGLEKWISHYCYTVYKKNGKPLGV